MPSADLPSSVFPQPANQSRRGRARERRFKANPLPCRISVIDPLRSYLAFHYGWPLPGKVRPMDLRRRSTHTLAIAITTLRNGPCDKCSKACTDARSAQRACPNPKVAPGSRFFLMSGRLRGHTSDRNGHSGNDQLTARCSIASPLHDMR
jgi:hypothetical protein